MSCKSKRAVFLFSMVFLMALFSHVRAHADTYELFQFTDHSGATPVLGIDNAGDVLYGGPGTFCGATATTCYSVFQPFGPGYTRATLPLFSYAGASSCSPNPQAFFGSCDNGFEAYFINTSPNRGVYVGTSADIQEFPGLIADLNGLFIDSYGDVAWTDGAIEMNFLAFDLTSHETPEPGTVALLLTGLILFAVLAHRRLLRSWSMQL
jgi:hypothetical protein